MSGRHHKRLSTRGADRRAFSLMVHGAEFGAGEELVLNPDCFPDIKVNDLVEISQPERDHHRLILQVMTLGAVRGKLQISILKDVAAQFGLDPFYSVVVQKIDPREVTVDFMEVTFRDQFVSRADIWRVKVAMLGKCVYIGKHVEALGVRSQVEALLADNQSVMCGVVGSDTKLIVRSRSSRLIWLVQMSTEMWEFAPDGELYYEKMLNRLLKVLIAKWTECSVSHSVTIIAFSRSYYDKNQFPDGYDPYSPLFRNPVHQGFGPGCSTVDSASGYGPGVRVESGTGRYYEDFYKILLMNYTGPDWNHLVDILKREFVQYHRLHRWRTPNDFIPAEYEICTVKKSDAEANDFGPAGEKAYASEVYVKWKSLPYGVPSRAVDGNILEAINVTLNIFDKHFMDRDLNRTGQSIVMVTAGSSVFRVDQHLVDVTKQRMMDNGVGMDMISLATPPLHVVPLFICSANVHNQPSSPTESSLTGARTSFRISMTRSPSSVLLHSSQPDASSTADISSEKVDCADEKTTRESYMVPHWVNITFLEFDCECTTHLFSNSQTSSRVSSKKLMAHRLRTCECQARLNKKFSPLPPFRMFDLTAPTENILFPVALANMMKSACPLSEESNRSIRSTHRSTHALPVEHDTLRWTLSNPRDTIVTNSSAVVSDRWHLCKSPDFSMARSPRLHNFAGPGFSASLMARETLEEYDADVFSPTKWKPSDDDEIGLDDGYMSPSFGDDTDFSSISLTGDMLSLLNSQVNNRWKSASSHAAVGSSSLVHSILSPRNSIPQSKSSLILNRPGILQDPLPMRRDSSSHSLIGLNHANARSSHTNTRPEEHATRSTMSRILGSKKSPPLAPTVPPGRAMPSAPTDIIRRNASKANELDAQGRQMAKTDDAIDTKKSGTGNEDTSLLSRSLKLHDRLNRSPTIQTPTASALVPSPMELSESYKKPYFIGSGVPPRIRRSDSDQTSTTPVVGSFHPSATDVMAVIGHQPFLHEVNPFKYSNETLESTAARLTSDRRRWSHLFPVLKQSAAGSILAAGEVKQTLTGPNWKSLTSPAILPLTTDYQPSPKELHTSYTESFYTLTLPSTDGDLFPKYKSHDELLVEMICQRLASDFQLVEHEATDVNILRRRGLGGLTHRGPSSDTRGSSSSTKTYNLSMGHRIHQIIYDADLQAIEVKRYVDRASQGQHNEPYVYQYSLWVDETQSFHPLQQNFYQYPMPEDNWNSLDHLLCGYHDELSESIKYRRIRFAVLPPSSVTTGTRADEEAYAGRFTKFVEYLQTRVASEHGAQEIIRIKVSLDPLPSPNLRQQVSTLSYKMSCESMASYTRLKSEDQRNEWLMMHVEDTMQVKKSYHFEVCWLACSGIIIDDFISTIRRKAKQAGLEMKRIPEYTSVSFLQIHPLIAPIFLPISLEVMQESEQEKAIVDVLVNQLDFVFDDEKLADSRGIGYGLGLGKEDKPTGMNGISRATSWSQRRVKSREETEALLVEKWRKRGYKQYTHRHAPVFLRLIHNGIVWIPSYDYDQVSTPQQVHDLFIKICSVIEASAALHDPTTTACGSEEA